jgi:ABC-2 type transport system ATP-binding protein
MPIIETRILRKEFGKLTAVHGLDLSINSAEVFGLLGPNGAGKTTTIMMLSTLLKPTSGQALVNGFDVEKQPAKVRQSIGMVFQEQTLDTLLTGQENMELHARLYGMPKNLRNQRVKELLDLVDLYSRKDDQTKKYSGGMRRRLEIARGLLHRPAVLFLDEPTIGLDPQTRDHIWNYVKRVVREEKTTVVLTTHYMEEADLMCDRVGIIDHGRIVALDRPAVLKATIGGAIVSLRAPKADIAALRRAPGVTRVEMRGDWVDVSLNNAPIHLPQTLAAVSDIESVEVHSPTLNDVFLKYTGRELRPNAEGEGESWIESVLKTQGPR